MLCDEAWVDPDLDVTNGLALKSQSDMLRLDALIMTVQLNIRKLLEVRVMAMSLRCSMWSAFLASVRFQVLH